MFEIFDQALEAQNITDGYAFQLFYMGVIPLGDFSSGFGGAGTWYIDEDGKCRYGATNDGMRACLECLNNWYEKGWINVGFEENTSDAMFWAVDSASVYSGKVGCCYGMVSAIGNQLEIEGTEESSPLHGIYYTGAAQPINDVYGDASVQNIEPFMYFANGAVSTGAILTNKLEGDEERIGAILTAVDYLYSDAAQEQSTRNSGISTIYAQSVPEFIVGTLDIENDADWQSYVDAINAYDPEAYCAEINAILGE